MANKRVQNAVLECSLRNDRMIFVHFQGKTFNITVIQVYALTNSAEELMLLNCSVEKTLESRLDCKEIKPVNLKGNQS